MKTCTAADPLRMPRVFRSYLVFPFPAAGTCSAFPIAQHVDLDPDSGTDF